MSFGGQAIWAMKSWRVLGGASAVAVAYRGASEMAIEPIAPERRL